MEINHGVRVDTMSLCLGDYVWKNGEWVEVAGMGFIGHVYVVDLANGGKINNITSPQSVKRVHQ